ncbi:MAG TPA: hypothetical protein VGI92_09075 [Gemmatimonadales bacterium]|jgi:hypothetical protein
MRGWRVPLVITAMLVAAQLFRAGPIVEVVSGAPPDHVHLAYPFLHFVFAPFTLLADYLNGGSATDLKAFGIWAVVIFLLARLGTPASEQKRPIRELRAGVLFLIGMGIFLWWGVRWTRPIPHLVADDSTRIIFDTHSHTSASHDGRPGFDAAANAGWHARAGFDAAFITDHNVVGAARQWRQERAERPPRLLEGEELSLAGLHLVVLGNRRLIDNAPAAGSFDSTLALIRRMGRDSSLGAGEPPYLIGSLPEYWRNHWGEDLGRLISAGVNGLEVWTTSPKAMDFPPALRRVVIGRAKADSIGLVGATDMHGIGYAASVWNVAPLSGWRAMSDSTLTAALIGMLRRSPGAVHVIAMRRVQGDSRLARAFELPAGLWMVLRCASLPHTAALLLWIWIPPLLRSRRPKPTA